MWCLKFEPGVENLCIRTWMTVALLQAPSETGAIHARSGNGLNLCQKAFGYRTQRKSFCCLCLKHIAT
ncbi:hypothetical protein ES332_A06G077900v1 [Gossypium tomentosum]|uniref:Uncharacterized protein n=1 Tax=Gossypium tomentosum TaxID=34277 RepID=A0A5D2Q1J0_GOSTO|nr:hypothetical protein ES332_A06G077900v1 [Gossypium tomentosum]